MARLLPDNYLHDIQITLDQGAKYRWELGRLLLHGEAEFLKYYVLKYDYKDMDPAKAERKARARLIDEVAYYTGADPSTLRDSLSMAKFFSDDDVETWHMYSYHQMRALKYAGDDVPWEDIAKWGLLQNDNGVPASVQQIRGEIQKRRDEKGNVWSWLNQILDLHTKIVDSSSDPKVIGALSLLPTIIQDTKELVDNGKKNT